MGVCEFVHVSDFAPNVAWTWYDAYALCGKKATYYACREIILIFIHTFVENTHSCNCMLSQGCAYVLTMIIL